MSTWHCMPEEVACLAAYGFENESDREAYYDEREYNGPIGRFDGRWYAWNRWGTRIPAAPEFLTDRDLVRRDAREKPVYYTLREPVNPKPKGSYNTLLLVPGKLAFSPGGHRKHSVLKEIGYERRDAWAVWEDSRGYLIENPLIDLDLFTSRGKRAVKVGACRRACGVIYARTLDVLEGIGLVEMVRYTTVKLEILDRAGEKPDVVRMWIDQHRDWSRLNEKQDLRVDDNSWAALVYLAAEQFDEHCVAATTELLERYEKALKGDREMERKRLSWEYEDERYGDGYPRRY